MATRRMFRLSSIVSLAIVILLTGCGDLSGTASSEQQQEEDFVITLIPQQNGTRVEWVTPSHLNITDVRILLEGHSANGTTEDQVDCSSSDTGYCNIFDLSSAFVYTLTISLTYQDGSQQIIRRRLELGANYDGDSLIDRLDRDDDNDGIIDERDNCKQGERGWLSNRSTDYDGDGCRDEDEDEDDDNDLVGDLVDLCPYSPPGRVSGDDSDGDGCRDRDEDAYLAGISNLTAVPMNRKVQLSWINPNASLNYIEIAELDDSAIKYIIPPFESYNLTRLNNHINYTFSITPHYASGGIGNNSIIKVRLGPNYDLDRLADAYDEDDDNDGVMDKLDNCPQGEIRWLRTADNDHDGDGCRDKDEDMSLPGISNLSITPIAMGIGLQLSWKNPPFQLDYVSISWAISNGTVGEILTLGEAHLLVTNLSTEYTFTLIPHYANGGKGEASVVKARAGANYDDDLLIDLLDEDDDNDGIIDEKDSCKQGKRGWSSNGSTDYDGDGCRDRDEDMSLPGISNLSVTPIARGIGLQLNWKNPPFPLDYVSISWAIRNGTAGEILALGESHLLVTNFSTEYTLTLIPHYANGGRGEASVIRARAETNHDDDLLIDLLDEDDDNDGLPDTIDLCDFSPPGFRFGSLDDIDRDGCHDREEDDFLPGVSRISAIPNSGQVFLQWRNPSVPLGLNYLIKIIWHHQGIKQMKELIATGARGITILDGLDDMHNYTFTMMIEYDNGALGANASIQVLVAPNYDNDNQADPVDADDDNDGVLDAVDECPQGQLAWLSTKETNHDGDGCLDRDEDTDDDNDGVMDRRDACKRGVVGWRSNRSNDTDEDGCRDRDEDTELAGVKHLVAVPAVAGVELRWINPDVPLVGFNISWVEPDGMNNFTLKADELTALGSASIEIGNLDDQTNFTFVVEAHYENGGTSQPAVNIRVQTGANHDRDELADSVDEDDDNDGVIDRLDACKRGVVGWRSNETNDNDADGCLDLSQEDTDDDNDGVMDKQDTCLQGETDWLTTAENDHDGDGCRDRDEDLDDDNDGLADEQDRCPLSPLGLDYLSDQDGDNDGCRDTDEDDFLPPVSKISAIPMSQTIQLSWINPNGSLASISVQWNSPAGDGISIKQDQLAALEQATMLIDGLVDYTSYSLNITPQYRSGVQGTSLSIQVLVAPNYDNDSRPDPVDDDDDNDGVVDWFDDCIRGIVGWRSNEANDNDFDGCLDLSQEDRDDDNDGLMDELDNCPQGVTDWLRTVDNDHDGDGCRDKDEDMSLPGISNLSVTPIAMGIGLQLSWKNPPFPLDYVNISWVVANGTASEILVLGESHLLVTAFSTEYTLTLIPHYANGGRGEASVVKARAGTNYDDDSLIDLLDEDDDNDGLPDTIDLCDFSPLGFRFGSLDDIDRDGCHDLLEDDSLPAVSKLSAFPYEYQIGLSWINPDLPLTNLSVHWTGDNGILWLDANTTSVNITGLRIRESYNLTIFTHYAGGLIGDPRSVEAQTDYDYDKDGQIDYLDEDDDNDGIIDTIDECDTSPIGYIHSPIEQDINGDGCQDIIKPDSLGVADLVSTPLDDAVELHWTNLYPSYILSVEVSWESSSSQENILLHFPDSSTNLRIDGLVNEVYQFYFSTFYDNGARSVYSTKIVIGPDYDHDKLADPGDEDDDNDGLADEQDNCPFSPLGFDYLSDQDGDHDGCRDRDEDDFLPGVSQISAIASSETVQLSWINPSGSLAYISVQGNSLAGGGTIIKEDQLAPLEPATMIIDGLVDYINYTFDITPLYRSGVEGNTSSIQVLVAPDYDNDNQIDLLDADDDNDGLPDTIDLCDFSPFGWISNDEEDLDGDGCRDRDEDDDDDNDRVKDIEDLDRDGDGLIEIASAESLFNIRYQLDGSGYRSSARAAINQRGCGGRSLINTCFGYELSEDISLADYPNWLPLASDLDPYQAGFQGTPFSGVFEGNGYEIRDLTIRRSSDDYQALFGRLEGARVSRLNMAAIRIAGMDAIASLAGEAINSSIANSVVSQATIRARKWAGGLVGRGKLATILSSSSIHNDLVGFAQTSGGLIGGGSQLTVRDSFNINSTVVSPRQTGGLIGGGSSISIDSSALIGARISGSQQSIGGLIGEASDVLIYNSSNRNSLILTSQALAGGLTGTGGLIGAGEQVVINASSLELVSVYGGRATGGLIGEGKITTIFSSFVHNSTIQGAAQTGGLIGQALASNRIREGTDLANFIYASMVMDGMITGTMQVGGLVGASEESLVLASYGTGLTISGDERTGGLIGNSILSSLVSSYIAASRLSRADCTGGLIGASANSTVYFSYAAVSQTSTSQSKSCHKNSTRVFDSYIEQLLGGNPTQLGSLQPTRVLKQPTSHTGIYANWSRGVDLDNADGDDGDFSGVEPITIWCDRDLSGQIEYSERDSANQLWNFGTSSDYPTLKCGPIAFSIGSKPFNDSINQTDDQEHLASRFYQRTIEASPIESHIIFDSVQQGTRNSYGSAQDPLIGFQWYLNRTGINRVWAQGHTGSGVHISLVDTGMELFHEDLIQNVVAGASRNFRVPEDHIYRDNPQGQSAHGTASAGTIAAKGDNGVGIKGMAPDAGIYGYTTDGRSNSEFLESLMPTTPQTAVSANVWGSFGIRLLRFHSDISSLIEDVLETQLSTGFYGKGISYTIAAHNARATGGSAQYMELRNHRAFINVCAVGPDNKYTYYSNPGANLWLCGPSSDNNWNMPICDDPVETWRCQITTTDISGEGGWNSRPLNPGSEIKRSDLWTAHTNFGGGDYYIRERNGTVTYLPPIAGDTSYTKYYGGTSASTPIVSGAIAVLRAANPHLSWRDVKLILAESAEQLEKDSPFWQVGAAAYHNHSQRYTHSIDYGFGMIDMVAAMKLAAEWQSLPRELRLVSLRGYEPLTASTQSTIRVRDRNRGQLDFIEHIDVDIDIDYDGNTRDLDVVLTSPHGTRSILSRRYGCVDSEEEECDKGLDWTFGTAAHLGEDPAGDWTLSVNLSSWDQDSRSWQPFTKDISYDHITLGWRMTFYGHRKRSQDGSSLPGLPGLPPPPPGGGFSP